MVFPEGRVPSTDRLERAFQDEYGLTEEADAFDVRVEGRLGTLETRVAPRNPRELSPFLDPPHVTWGLSFDDDTRSLTVRHEAGEAVDAGLLWYDLETEAAPGRLDPRPLWEDARRVAPGDSDTVDLTERPDATGVDLVLAREECCDFRILYNLDLE